MCTTVSKATTSIKIYKPEHMRGSTNRSGQLHAHKSMSGFTNHPVTHTTFALEFKTT